MGICQWPGRIIDFANPSQFLHFIPRAVCDQALQPIVSVLLGRLSNLRAQLILHQALAISSGLTPLSNKIQSAFLDPRLFGNIFNSWSNFGCGSVLTNVSQKTLCRISNLAAMHPPWQWLESLRKPTSYWTPHHYWQSKKHPEIRRALAQLA